MIRLIGASFALWAWFAACFLAVAGDEADELQTKATEWCRITVPSSVKAGEDLTLQIERMGLEGKLFLSCDLKDQDNRMVKWGGPPRPIEEGGRLTYSLPVGDGVGVKSVHVLLYATRRAEDDWQAAVAQATSPPVPISGRSPHLDFEYNKSWLYIDASNAGQPLVSGETWEVPVEYNLDPSEYLGETTLYIWGTGPWIDVPDGKYVTKRGHIGYPGMSRRLQLTEPGRGRHVFSFKVPDGLKLVKRNNRMLLLAGYRDARGDDWPWHVRAETSFVRAKGRFEIETDVPGNLFTYEQPVRIAIRLKNVEEPGQTKTLRWQVHDTRGELAAEGQKDFTASENGQLVVIDLDLGRRGVFLVQLDVPGWEKRHTTIARIPDLAEISGGRPTRFGMTSHWEAPPEEVWAVARRLGLSSCRRFTRWYGLQPGPKTYKLDELERELDSAAKHGVDVWLCIVEPPPLARLGKAEPISYRAFEFKEDIWREFVQTVGTRLKGKLYGWEWLNEITPGGCADSVATYVAMCRIGTETAKAADPDVLTILAGGLYPRSFRKAVLTAGVGRYVDVLPVHYQNGNGILEAKQDLAAAGHPRIAVWEDESARPRNAWAVPPLDELRYTGQSEWVLRQWTDELAAGCEKIIYFGGTGSAAGNFGYLLDDLSPRPVAATLAVFTAKTFDARPLGSFLLQETAFFHLFERQGKPLLVASTYDDQGQTVRLDVGSESLQLTDYQGNQSRLSSPGGRARLPLGRLPVFVEGADLDVLKAYVVARIDVARVGSGTSAGVAGARRVTPRVSMLRSGRRTLAVRLRNVFGHQLSGRLRIELPGGWPAAAVEPFSLAADEERVVSLGLTIPDDALAKEYPVRVALDFDQAKLPAIEKPVVLSVISSDMLGNLLVNGDFETPDASGEGPLGWRVDGTVKKWAAADGLGDGLGRRVLKFEDASGWNYVSREVPVRGGQTYLYTFWVRNENMGCGSNMTQHMADGKEIRLYDSQVIRCGDNNPHWQMFACRKEMPEGTKTVSFTPVANGTGWAMIDNIRVTLFEGSDYVAEAHRAGNPPVIDGRLDDWPKQCPVPLLGSSQLTTHVEGYTWSPEDLSGVAYLMWDEENFYFALQARDDTHHATGSGQLTAGPFLQGDSLLLAIDPARGGPDAASRAMQYCISAASPGAGSGSYTLIRPSEHCAARPPGHLFRDSSIYDLAVVPGQGTCVYELRIPLAEIGVQGTAGTKLGFSAQINDNDGGGPVSQINWGEGLQSAWAPEIFGVVTLVE